MLPHVSLAEFQMLRATAVCALTHGLQWKEWKAIDSCYYRHAPTFSRMLSSLRGVHLNISKVFTASTFMKDQNSESGLTDFSLHLFVFPCSVQIETSPDV